MFDRPEPPAGSAAPVARVRLRPLRGAPEQREMVLILGLAFFLNLFPGTFLQILNTRWGLVITQTAFIAGPVLLALRWFYLDRRAVLPLRRPALDILAATALGTVGLNHLLTIAGAWQERLFPTPDSLRAFFINLFVYDGPVDYALLLVVFAVVPAICEEILFRGFLQTGLVRLLESPSRGIAASSLVFALFHLDPWRFAGILVLGAFLGYLTCCRSAWPPPAPSTKARRSDRHGPQGWRSRCSASRCCSSTAGVPGAPQLACYNSPGSGHSSTGGSDPHAIHHLRGRCSCGALSVAGGALRRRGRTAVQLLSRLQGQV
jgi:membrane protease YdiL (CAAX protease family)